MAADGHLKTVISTFGAHRIMKLTYLIVMAAALAGCTTVPVNPTVDGGSKFSASPSYGGLHLWMKVNGQLVSSGKHITLSPSRSSDISATVLIGNPLPQDIFVRFGFTDCEYHSLPSGVITSEPYPSSKLSPVHWQRLTHLKGSDVTSATPGSFRDDSIASSEFVVDELAPDSWSTLSLTYTIDVQYFIRGEPTEYQATLPFEVTIHKEDTEQSTGE